MNFKELLGIKKQKQWQISSKLSLFCNKYNIMVKAEPEKGTFLPTWLLVKEHYLLSYADI